MIGQTVSHYKILEKLGNGAMGVVLYELLTGRVRFDGDHEAEVLYGIMNRDPEPLVKYRSDIPEGMQRVIEKGESTQREAGSEA